MDSKVFDIYKTRLKALIKKRETSATAVSLSIGANKGLLSDSFSDGSIVKIDNLYDIAQHLDTTIDYILGMTDSVQNDGDNELPLLASARVMTWTLNKFPDESIEKKVEAFEKASKIILADGNYNSQYIDGRLNGVEFE